MNILLI